MSVAAASVGYVRRCFPPDVIHEDVLAQMLWRRKERAAAIELRHALHELRQRA